MSQLEVAWCAAVESLRGDRAAAAASALDLQRRYAEPHRHYHNAVHVEAVLDRLERVADELDLPGDARSLLDLAGCAHDVVYDCSPGDDERASAGWLREQLTTAGVANHLVARAVDLVLATASHDVRSGDALSAALIDVDLAVLADPPDAYDAYVVAVRQEYLQFDDEQWRRGRAAVLQGFIERPHLFLTPYGRREWEGPARANVTRELAQLGGPPAT